VAEPEFGEELIILILTRALSVGRPVRGRERVWVYLVFLLPDPLQKKG
jgi:hypothetical protein